MILNDTFRLALRNLRQARLRTALTTLGVAIGVAALAGMMSFGVGLQERLLNIFSKSGVFDSITVFPVNSGFGRMRTGAEQRRPGQEEKPTVPLDDSALQRLRSLGKVKEAFPNLRIPLEVKYASFSEFTAAAAIPLSARGEGIFQTITHGSFFANETDSACILSMDFAKRIRGIEPKDLIGKEITLAYAASGSGQVAPLPFLGALSVQRVEKPYRVVGILEREPGPTMGIAMFASVMIPLTKAQEMGATDISNPQALLQQLSNKRTYGSVTVKARRPQDVEDLEKVIKDMGFQTFSLVDALKGAKRDFILMDIFLSLIGSIALTVASLGIVNTMVMSILERTREIGIMKAIGGSDADVRKIFLVEAAAIGLAGGVAGILLGWGASRAINYGANLYIQSQGGTTANLFSLPWWLILGGIGFSITVSLIAGSYPASRAAKLDPIQALRHD